MRGYFGIGSEGLSKPHNLGVILRTAHAFGASFAFTIGSDLDETSVRQTDTSGSATHLPYYRWPNFDPARFPEGCVLVGVELTDDAVDLPSFRHPLNAAYILGPEKGSLSRPVQDACAHIVKIPTAFCINVGLATALTLYDRSILFGGHAPRPLVQRRRGQPGVKHKTGIGQNG
ncbi:RNA methyltransferase [Algimonas porphyrae]|uniref:rRNA methyltransferase n=1 Tax=Algimonas porphyrae TaxID=1128113 RepID=A0ABQ5UZI6_9PROT|nr:RNA methyltransferase [Algimonas porphyrae]GLQ20611.1 rRNA methyltransferase [Algimonas porphyrae]